MKLESSVPFFLRVDDRLIHGQVMVTWVRDLGVKTIYVVSDRVVEEPLEIMLLEAAVTQDIHLEVLSTEDAIAKLQQSTISPVMVMVENLDHVLALANRITPLPEVNLGGIRYRPGKSLFHKAIYLDEHDHVCLDELEKLEVKITMQTVPSDRKVDVFEKRRKKGGRGWR